MVDKSKKRDVAFFGEVRVFDPARQVEFFGKVRQRRQITLDVNLSDALSIENGDMVMLKVVGVKKGKKD